MVTMSTSSSPIPTNDVSTTSAQKKSSSENRRSNKPIMEKRRRARINNCLNELKSLILDAMKKDPARHSKLEKADILEMTVKHLESLQRQQVAMTAATDPNVMDKFRAGFSECAGEVGRYPGLDPPVRRRLLQHLANCLTSTGTPSREAPKNLQVHILPSDAQNSIFLSAGANSGVQLVPTRLPNGDIALVLPSSNALQQRVSSPSSSSSSPSPTAVNSETSNSPMGFERLSVNIPSSTTTEDMCQSPTDSSMYSNPASPGFDYNAQPYSPQDQKPLALVVRECYSDEEKPWRPW